MKKLKIKHIYYQPGDEKILYQLLHHASEPLLISIKNFPKHFTPQYFTKFHNNITSADHYVVGQERQHYMDKISNIIAKIIDNKPHRIFGETFPPELTKEIEQYVPLWIHIKARPKYFSHALKVLYFFGAKGVKTPLHYDIEHPSLLHLCLSGRKKFILFTQKNSSNLYQNPYTSDSSLQYLDENLVDSLYPKFKQAQGYEVILNCGDMLFMPRNCWHYAEYLSPSSAACYAFYPNKFHQILGYFSGNALLAFRPTMLNISSWKTYQRFKNRFNKANPVELITYKIFIKLTKPIIFFILFLYTKTHLAFNNKKIY